MNASRMVVIVCLVALAAPAGAQEKEGVSVTVYNGGYGVVREVRNLTIAADGDVKFTDVASGIDATTVHFKSLTDPAAKLLEQNYQYDLVNADKLLRKYVDKPIDVVCPGKTYSGTLLSFDGAQIVLKEDAGGIVMVQRADNVRDIRFKMLPEGLLTRPTLLWKVATAKPGNHLTEVTYQTGGMTWHAEYVLVLGAADTSADLSGWVSVNNHSGKTYKDSKIKCIAGDVHRAAAPPSPMLRREVAKAAGEGQAPMVEKAFFEYHMYTLPRPSTVADSETKQLEMFTPVREMKVAKKFLYNPLRQYRWYGGYQLSQGYGGTNLDKKVQVFIEFANAKANKLGIPLPAGKIRVYKQDPDDKALEFVGEERIDHTPEDEELSLLIGNAFDVVGERRQTAYSADANRHWIKESIEIKVRNHKAEDIVVRIKEPMYRARNWKITEETHQRVDPDKARFDAHTVAWDLPVKSKGEVVLKYTAEYTW